MNKNIIKAAVVGYGFSAKIFHLPPVVAIGLIRAGCAPGAMASNVMCYRTCRYRLFCFTYDRFNSFVSGPYSGADKTAG